MHRTPSRASDIIAAIVQRIVLVGIGLITTLVVFIQRIKALARPVTDRLPSFDEFRTVFPQILVFVFLMGAVPVTLIATAINAQAKAILKALKGIEAVVAGTAYFLAFLIIFAEIVAREVFGSTIGGTQEAAILGAVIAGFIGFALVTGAGAHLRINLLDVLAPKNNMRAFERVTDLVAVFILAGLAITAATFVHGTFDFGDRVRTLLIPLWPFQLVMVYAFGASALRHLIYFINPDLRPAPPVAAH